MQGASAAVTDGIALRTAKFITGNFIPVLGRMFTDATDTVISASVLLKNTVGLVGVAILISIAAFPAIKVLSLALIYKLAAAILQPLGGGPIISCLDVISKVYFISLLHLLSCRSCSFKHYRHYHCWQPDHDDEVRRGHLLSFLTEWITSIILFILFAIVIDLLLPNSSMQKYAKMVVSLLLIVVMLNPIFALFRADPDKIFSELMKGKEEAQSEEIKSDEFRKKEIQASQRAYILKQMAVQLEKSAKEPLEKESYEMKRVEVLADEEHLDQNMEADQFRIKAVLSPLTGDAVETVARWTLISPCKRRNALDLLVKRSRG